MTEALCKLGNINISVVIFLSAQRKDLRESQLVTYSRQKWQQELQERERGCQGSWRGRGLPGRIGQLAKQASGPQPPGGLMWGVRFILSYTLIFSGCLLRMPRCPRDPAPGVSPTAFSTQGCFPPRTQHTVRIVINF